MDGDPRRDHASTSRRIYEALLWAYPRGFRERYGPEMADLFEDECTQEVERRGTRGLVGVWTRGLADLMFSALAERSGAAMFSVGLIKWGGVTAMLGGLLITCGGMLFATVGNGGFNTSSTLSFFLSHVTSLGTPLIFGALAGRLAYFLSLFTSFGMLMIFGALAGLTVSIGRQGALREANAEARSSGEGRYAGVLGNGRSSRLSLPQHCAKWGFALAVVTAVAVSVELVWVVSSGGLTGGYATGLWGESSSVLVFTLGTMRMFGLPLSTALVGVAVWRSGVLGPWRGLPLLVALLSSPLPSVLMFVLVLGGPTNAALMNTLDLILILGVPSLATGIGWALLGLMVAKSAEDVETSLLPAP